jgi:hypothetical protein
MWLGVLAMVSGSVVMMAAPAYAICDAPRTRYEFSNKRPSRLATNVKTPWGDAGGSATLANTYMTTVNASATATVTAEAKAVFVSASASLGVTVGKSWSQSHTFSYSKPVPAGKQGRLVVYRDSMAFTVTKKSLRSPCRYVTVYRQKVNAPLKRGDYSIGLQLRDPRRGISAQEAPGEGGQSVPSQDDDQYDTEINLGVISSSDGAITN